MSVPALKIYSLPESAVVSPLARIGGARNPRGLATIRQIRREQARVYLAAKRGDIPPETCTRLTYALRELVRTLELESGPLDQSPSPKGDSPAMTATRARLTEMFGGPSDCDAAMTTVDGTAP